MDKMRVYYEQIQKDVDLQLSDMRRNVDLLEDNHQAPGDNRSVDSKYRKIVIQLQMEVNRIKTSFMTFQNSINAHLQTSN